MLVSKDQLDKVLIQINEIFERHERQIRELREKIDQLDDRPKVGRPKKEAA